MTQHYHYNAEWKGSYYLVTLRGSTAGNLTSSDGYEWYDDMGNKLDQDEFNTTILVLIGGPRDGETVCV